MPKLLSLILALLICVFCISPASATPSLVVDGRPLALETLPITQNDHLLVPLRAVLESLHASVIWDPTNQEIHVSKGVNQVSLTIGGSIASFNGKGIEMGAPVQMVDGKVMVPLRFLSEAFGMTINWIEFDANNQIIVLRNPLIAYKTGLLDYTSRHTKWGQNINDVMASEPTLPSNSNNSYLFYSHVDFEGVPADLGYFFVGNRLGITMYDFHGERQSTADSLNAFNQVSAILNSRYGEPIANIQNGANEGTVSQDELVEAIGSGELKLFRAWIDEYTMVCLFLNDEGKNLGMVFSDIDQVDRTLISLMGQGLSR